MPFIYLLEEGLWAETWRKDQKRQPTNGKKSCSPLNGQKIVKVTVIPIKRFALMKSYIFIDVIKGNRMALTNAELIKRIICEEFFDYSLGGCYFRRLSISS
jgi:hypothetical protein